LAGGYLNDVIDLHEMRRSEPRHSGADIGLKKITVRLAIVEVIVGYIRPTNGASIPESTKYCWAISRVYPSDKEFKSYHGSILAELYLIRQHFDMRDPWPLVGNKGRFMKSVGITSNVNCSIGGSRCSTGGYGGPRGGAESSDQGEKLQHSPAQLASSNYVGLSDAFDRAPLGAQIRIFGILGFTAVSTIAAGLAWILILDRRRWIGAFLIGLGCAAWAVAVYLTVVGPSEGRNSYRASDNHSDDAPMASMAAIRNHAGNAPRLIFTVMDPSVSGIPASVNRLAFAQTLRLSE
jgi:hypothetical protein